MINLPTNVKICNLENQEQLNRRLFNRNIPSAELAPNFSFRPTPSFVTSRPKSIFFLLEDKNLCKPKIKACAKFIIFFQILSYSLYLYIFY